MNRLFQTLAFSLMLVATAGNTQTNLDEFPLLGAAPDPNDLFLMVDVDPVGGNSTKNVLFSNITTHNHTESQITDLDKYTQAVVDGLLAGKTDTGHTHTEANITDLGAYLETVTAADVDAEASTDGHVLTSDGAGNAAWEAVSGGGGSSTLDGLTDTTLTSPSDGQVLTYDNATSKWINAASAGGGGAAGNATSRFLIEEITLTTAGDFYFDNIPGDYDKLWVEGDIRGTAAANNAVLNYNFNGDTTSSKYHRQVNASDNNSAANAEAANNRAAVNIVVATGATDVYTNVVIEIPAPNSANRKLLRSHMTGHHAEGAQYSGEIHSVTTITDAITSFEIEGPAIGTLRLYGERSITVEDSETITVKQEVPVTLTAGEFDIDLTNYQDGDRLVIYGEIVSAATGTLDSVNMYLNADTTDANYYVQEALGYNGAASVNKNALPYIAYVPAASSPSDATANIRIVMEDYAGSGRKAATSTASSRNDTAAIVAGVIGYSSSITAAITSVNLKADGGEDLSGTLHAYIEKQGVLPAIPRAEGKVELQTITNTTAGEFDFDLSALTVPDGIKRLIIKGSLRGDVSATTETVYAFLNADTTATNYHSQKVAAYGGAANINDASEPAVGVVTGATSPANSYGSLSIVFEDYAGSNIKTAEGNLNLLRAAGEMFSGHAGMSHDSLTDPITRIRIRTDNHATDQLLGTLTLYGEY